MQPESISRASVLLATGIDLGIGTRPNLGVESRSRTFVQSVW